MMSKFFTAVAYVIFLLASYHFPLIHAFHSCKKGGRLLNYMLDFIYSNRDYVFARALSSSKACNTMCAARKRSYAKFVGGSASFVLPLGREPKEVQERRSVGPPMRKLLEELFLS